jgi:hypothetical protein
MLMVLVVILVASSGGCARVGQNETAIQTTNGVISNDRVKPELQWY